MNQSSGGAGLQVVGDPTDVELAADPAAYVVEACERAKAWLANALEHGDIEQIVELKSQAEAIRVYTRQKELGKDSELSAAEIVRRAERGIGLAIRRGQENGEIRTPHNRISPANQYGKCGADVDHISTKKSPSDFVTKAELSGNRGSRGGPGIYALTDDVSDEAFENAIEDAKAERNLSRANVVRKAKGVSPKASDRHEVLRNTRRLDPHRIVNESVLTLDSLCPGLDLLVPDDYDALDKDEVEHWCESLNGSMRILNRMKKELGRVRD